MNAPTMIINKINNTKIIAALKPFPHPQLFIIHSSFICLFIYILRKKFDLVLGFLNDNLVVRKKLAKKLKPLYF